MRGERTWVRAVIGALALATLTTGLANTQPSSPVIRTHDSEISVPGGPTYPGTVRLPTRTYLPAKLPAPAVVVSPGFGGSRDTVDGDARYLAAHGFVVVTWTMRGFAPGSGHLALDAPDTEVADLRHLIDVLALSPDVVQDAPGDPRVGLVGESYGGGISLQGAAYDQRVDAIVPVITWNSLVSSLLPGGVFKAQYAAVFFDGAAGSGCLLFAQRVCDAYERVAETGTADAAARTLLQDSSPPVGRIKAPTLLIQGQDDTLFPLSESLTTARSLAAQGTPVHLAWFNGGHDAPFSKATQDAARSVTLSWFDRWLRKDPKVKTGPVFRWDRSTGGTGTARQLPPLARPLVLTRKSDEQLVDNPPGGRPAGISSVPGLSAISDLAGGLGFQLPGQTAHWDTAALPRGEELVGDGALRLHVSSSDGTAVLYVKVLDVAPDGSASLPHGQVAPVRLDGVGGAGRSVTVLLPTLAHVFPAGHRVRIAVSTTDLGYAGPTQSATYKLTATQVILPLVPLSAGDGYGSLALVAGLLLAALLTVIGVIVVRRRRRPADLGDDTSPPVEVRGLAKTYAGGLRAVDGIDLVVERGQVLGLLGPNGAGKTTALRMLAGLIAPTEGEVRLFGRRVTSGADVLSRVGLFIEGPGLLPHLSGMDNLRLYWTSAADSMDDAHLEEALEIAGLGSAIHRPVRTYSHGMKQRLAIAQAMLGKPDLLVLDEPTNGLDPPQIKHIREVLRAVAGTGRTVLVSSHLLSEVEQTCSHVAIMSNGRMIASGRVEDLLRSGQHLEDVFMELVGSTS